MHTFLDPVATPAAAEAEFALSLLGPSAAMAQLWSQVRRLAPHIRTALLTGHPGCGQEAAARLLLDLSPRRRPFVHLEAADANEASFALSGPHSLAADAFLYISSVERLSTQAQAALLRLLRHRRPGTISVVASIYEDLRTLVGVGRFLPELAEALGTVHLQLPPLRQRSEDLPMLLSQMFCLRAQLHGKSVPQYGDPLLREAMQYSWPGNLDDLSAALALAKPGVDLSAADLQLALTLHRIPPASTAGTRMVKLDTVVQEHIYAVLKGCRGNKQRAAEVLGISRSTLYRMLETTQQGIPFALAS